MSKFYYYSRILLKLRGKAIKDSSLSRKTKIGSGSWVIRSEIERCTYTGYECKIFDTSISSFCSIGHNVSIGVSNHPINLISTSPIFYEKNNILKTNIQVKNRENIKRTRIDSDVWIGSGTFVKAGVHIAKRTIIGMASVLTKDRGPYEIWAGNLARLIKKRFNDDKINRIIEVNWEEWNIKKIRNNTNFLYQIVVDE